MKNDKTSYECSSCGYKNSRWYGKCPSCGEFNTFEEVAAAATARVSKPSKIDDMFRPRSEKMDKLETPNYIRMGSGMSELDRVLGGGLVNGSAILISGEPGIGKSTLLMQICGTVGNEERVLYVSGEESGSQLKLRAKRLGVCAAELYVLNETNAANIMAEIDELQPSMVIIDSIQTVFTDISQSSPGSVSQVRESSMLFINKAKSEGFSVILVGHVNKEGGIAGPKVLEHMVDAVLYFEGEKQHAYRIIRAVKNRFGSTNEIGVFEMTEKGLMQVPNPSEALLRERPKNVSGSCAVCVMEGSRPIITEIQALVTPSIYPSPKRAADGVDINRVCLLLAVLEKRLGLHFSQNDVYINVTGGLYLSEPASDLAVCLALISGILDRVLPDDFLAFGEIGLSGECRTVAVTDQRVKEAERLGFHKVMLPARSAEKLESGIKVIGVKRLFDAVKTEGIFAKKVNEEL